MSKDSTRRPSGTEGRVRRGRKGPRACKIAGCLLLLAVGWIPGPAWGLKEPPAIPLTKETLEKGLQVGKWNKDAPVDIQSDRMTVDFEAHRVIFTGNVKVRQSDFSLSAREVTTTFGKTADDILKIVAQGDVKIQKAEKMAWGQKAVYDRQSAVIVLTGDPVLRQGRNFIKGDEIRVRLDEDRMEVRGGVEAEFRLEEQGAEEAPDGL